MELTDILRPCGLQLFTERQQYKKLTYVARYVNMSRVMGMVANSYTVSTKQLPVLLSFQLSSEGGCNETAIAFVSFWKNEKLRTIGGIGYDQKSCLLRIHRGCFTTAVFAKYEKLQSTGADGDCCPCG
jgi:hypothetical protein